LLALDPLCAGENADTMLYYAEILGDLSPNCRK